MLKRITILLLSIVISACGRKTVQNEEELINSSLIFSENRTQILEHKQEHTLAVGHLQIYYDFDRSPRACTASLIDKKHIITASHCLYNEDLRKFPIEVIFTPGALSENSGKQNRYFATDLWINKTYIRYHDTGFTKGVEAYDYAVVKLDKEVSGITPFKIDKTKKKEKSRSGIILHYPSDKKKKTLWQSFCSFSSKNKRVLEHKCATVKGSSGAPILFYDNSSKAYKLKGIHHGGSKDYTNYAARIDKRARKLIDKILKSNSSEKKFKHIELDVSPTYSISVRNNCSYDAKVALAYTNESGRFLVEGIYNIPMGEKFLLSYSIDKTIYISAYDIFRNNFKESKIKINSARYGHLNYYKKDIKYRYASHIEELCDEKEL